MYAANTWNAAHFPFLSQQLFYENGTSLFISAESRNRLLPPLFSISVVHETPLAFPHGVSRLHFPLLGVYGRP